MSSCQTKDSEEASSSGQGSLFADLPKRSLSGTGKCCACGNGYSNRWKPKDCGQCGSLIGGWYVPKIKKAKLSTTTDKVVRVCSMGDQHEVNVFSVRTTSRDNRCFVAVGLSADGLVTDKICYSRQCLVKRSIFANSGKLGEFKCQHLDALQDRNGPSGNIYMVESFTEEDIETFTPDATMQEEMKKFKNGFPTVVKLSESCYVTRGEVSSTSPLGFIHVSRKVDDCGTLSSTILECTSGLKTCKTCFKRSKMAAQRSLCLHLHLVILAIKSKEEKVENIEIEEEGRSSSSKNETTAEDQDDHKVIRILPGTERHQAQCSTTEERHLPLWQKDLETQNVNLPRQSTLKIQMQRSLPYVIPFQTLKKLTVLDSLNVNGDSCWPDVFQPSNSICLNCNQELPEPSHQRGQSNSTGSGVLISHNNPFKRISILVRKCRNKDCLGTNHAFPLECGLFNICNKILISLDILLEWRELMKTGLPLTNIISGKLNGLLFKVQEENKPTEEELEYFTQLLYKGFYGFEVMTDRDLNDNICGICGIIGEVYLGDGNEKICCSTSEVTGFSSIPEEVGSNSEKPSLSSFLDRIKIQFIEQCTFAKAELKFSTLVGAIPPIIPPALRKEEINSELEKNSIYLKDKGFPGDPVLLAKLMKERKLSIQDLTSMNKEQIDDVCKYCKIVLTGKSKDILERDLGNLYGSIVVGTSPCHGFTKSKGRTGGFYHIVCRHGCTVATKLMMLKESVRDAADLYLSLKNPPITFVCDTPCTFVRHMNLRVPEFTNKIWGEFDGCFEKPQLGIMPTHGVSLPLIVPSEFHPTDQDASTRFMDGELSELTHPVSKSSRRIVVGDRFHSLVHPHKSELCKYHDIDLCLQSATLKTSYQESRNKAKKDKRIQSACTQNFHTHYLYNYLMDIYQNEFIVNRQMKEIRKVNNCKGELKRDEFYRFIL